MTRNIVVAFIAVLVFGLLQGCNPGGPSAGAMGPSKNASLSDVEFARTVFTALANGDQSIASDIDWGTFKVGTQDVGSKYNTFNDEPNHKAFRDAFIPSFSKSFKGTGARAESLTNWAVKAENANQSVVSAETLSKSHMLFTISKKGGDKKLSDIQNAP